VDFVVPKYKLADYGQIPQVTVVALRVRIKKTLLVAVPISGYKQTVARLAS
jgi:hypothetical protein